MANIAQFKKEKVGTSLVVQWLSNCLPMQGAQVPSLVRKTKILFVTWHSQKKKGKKLFRYSRMSLCQIQGLYNHRWWGEPFFCSLCVYSPKNENWINWYLNIFFWRTKANICDTGSWLHLAIWWHSSGILSLPLKTGSNRWHPYLPRIILVSCGPFSAKLWGWPKCSPTIHLRFRS